MAHRCVISASRYGAIERHLLQGQDEQAAFVFATASGNGADIRFEAADHYLAGADDLEHQSGYHITMTDDALGRVIKMAWDRQTALVELHSHPDPCFPIGFSPSDLSGFEQVVPHVRWRLKGQPYLAVVVGPGGFDALVWSGNSTEPEPLEQMIIGSVVRTPSGITLRSIGRADGYRAV